MSEYNDLVFHNQRFRLIMLAVESYLALFQSWPFSNSKFNDNDDDDDSDDDDSDSDSG